MKYYIEYLILEEDRSIVNTMEKSGNIFSNRYDKKSYAYRDKRRYVNTKITIIFEKLKCNPSNMQCLLIRFCNDKDVSVVDSSVLYNYI